MKLRPARRGSLAKRPAGAGAEAVEEAGTAVETADSAGVDTGADTDDRGVGFKITGSFSHAHRPSSRCAQPGNPLIIPGLHQDVGGVGDLESGAVSSLQDLELRSDALLHLRHVADQAHNASAVAKAFQRVHDLFQ